MTRPSAPHHPDQNWLNFCVWFFTLRPLLTLCLHSQLVLPTRWFPGSLLALHRWYVTWSGDPLLKVPPTWFQGIVIAMLTLQLPFEAWVGWEMYNESTTRWIQMVPYYAVHVVTCLMPVFAELLMEQHVGMNLMKTLAPKVADLGGVLMLAYFAYMNGAFAVQPPLSTAASTSSGKSKVM